MAKSTVTVQLDPTQLQQIADLIVSLENRIEDLERKMFPVKVYHLREAGEIIRIPER